MERRKLIPTPKGDFKNIYLPKPDVYNGPKTESFTAGEVYDEWIPNDFTFIKDKEGVWHAFGITHPRPECFIDDYNCAGNGHEAEYQLFHATYKGSLQELLSSGAMKDEEKVLYPAERTADEPLECWAPCVIEKDGKYYMFYSPGSIRLAVSDDLYNWEAKGIVFEGAWNMRDPYVFFENGIYTMIYVSDDLYYRTSTDLIEWSEEQLFQKNAYPGSAQESPCVIKHGEMYYLIWCMCDGSNGWYDDRTFVFASESLYGFNGKTPVTMLKGHAPEIISEDGKDYYVSVFYPKNGLNMKPVAWEEI